MNRERQILAAAIQSRQAYDRVANHVTSEDWSDQGSVIWSGIQAFYDTDAGAVRVDSGLLSESIGRRLSNDKHKAMFSLLCEELGSADISASNIVQDVIATRRDNAGKALAAAIHSGGATASLVREYEELLSAETLGEEEEEVEARQGMAVVDLVQQGFDPEGLIKIAPVSLNTRLKGGVKPGHHIVLFARPEMGKTMMTIEMMAGFARDGHTCLYIGNEDPIDDINMRLVNRLSLMTKEEVMGFPEGADERARMAGYENIILQPLAPGTPREITTLMEKYKPQVLVLDQLRNLNMMQDNYVLALENAAKQARQWAKKYSCVVVSVTQAGDSAAGKAVLDLGDVDYSNTGIPAQADLMIGLGANQQHKDAGELVISLPKNKISGTHEFFAVTTDPSLSMISSI